MDITWFPGSSCAEFDDLCGCERFLAVPEKIENLAFAVCQFFNFFSHVKINPF